MRMRITLFKTGKDLLTAKCTLTDILLVSTNTTFNLFTLDPLQPCLGMWTSGYSKNLQKRTVCTFEVCETATFPTTATPLTRRL